MVLNHLQLIHNIDYEDYTKYIIHQNIDVLMPENKLKTGPGIPLGHQRVRLGPQRNSLGVPHWSHGPPGRPSAQQGEGCRAPLSSGFRGVPGGGLGETLHFVATP